MKEEGCEKNRRICLSLKRELYKFISRTEEMTILVYKFGEEELVRAIGGKGKKDS